MDFRQRLFQYRSYTPIPFLILMVIFAMPTVTSLSSGFSIIVIGEWIRLWAVAIAGSETRTTGPVGGTYLITSGPFSYVRNPLYLGNMILYFGIGVMSMALFPWLIAAASLYFLFQYSQIVTLEETYLEQRFGEDFARYRQSVPRFFPTSRKYAAGSHDQPKLDWLRGVSSEKRSLQAIGLLTMLLLVVWRLRG